MSRLGLPVSHSGQNVIHLCARAAWKGRKNNQQPFTRPRSRVADHVPAVQFGRAKHDDPVMPRRIPPHELVHDEGGHGSGAEHGEQLEGDDCRISSAPACVRRGVFAPCGCRTCVISESGEVGISRDPHISAKGPEDEFTVRPNVDRARKEPSKVKWMSASNVCGGSDRRRRKKEVCARHTWWLSAGIAKKK